MKHLSKVVLFIYLISLAASCPFVVNDDDGPDGPQEFNQDIAAAGNAYVVVWEVTKNGLPGREIRGKRITNINEIPMNSEIVINTLSQGNQRQPAVSGFGEDINPLHLSSPDYIALQ